MASSKKKAKGHAKPAKKQSAPAKKASRARPKPAPPKAALAKASAAKPAATKPAATKAAAAKAAPPKPAAPAAPVKIVSMKPGAATGTRPAKRSTRRSPLANRRGPDGQPFVPGDLLLPGGPQGRSEEHTSELQSRGQLVCRLLLEK